MLRSPINIIYYFLGPYSSIWVFPWTNIISSSSLDTIVKLYMIFFGSFFEVAATKAAFNSSRLTVVCIGLYLTLDTVWTGLPDRVKNRCRILILSIFTKTASSQTFKVDIFSCRSAGCIKTSFWCEVEWQRHCFFLHRILFEFPRNFCMSEWISRLDREIREKPHKETSS